MNESSVLLVLRTVPRVHTAVVELETKQAIVCGDMNPLHLCEALQRHCVDASVVSVKAQLKSFHFDLRKSAADRLALKEDVAKMMLAQIEGVENVIIAVELAQVMVQGFLDDSTCLREALIALALDPLEILEIAAIETTASSLASSPSPTTIDETDEFARFVLDDPSAEHVCDPDVCAHNGCEQYLMQVAHTAALAIGWVVPGCAMSWGGECSCGDDCQCAGCPRHNPATMPSRD